MHTCDFGAERALTPGEDFRVAELDTACGRVKVGAMICYDREFPESARILMLRGAELSRGFSFTKGMPVLKLKNEKDVSQSHYPTVLYDLARDPAEAAPVEDAGVQARMEAAMQALMRRNDCPEEVFHRYFG